MSVIWGHSAMDWNRVISGLLAVIYLAIAFAHGGIRSGFEVGIGLVFPLACIWFADAMGGYTGPTMSMAITQPSPGVIVCVLGWFILLLPLIIGIGYVLFHTAS
jgi:hypothetical protein